VVNDSFLFHEPFAFLRLFGEDMPLKSLLESDFPGAGDLEPFFGTRICFNLWHLMMTFYMIPCGRACTGKPLRGPFGQSGFHFHEIPAIKNGARSYVIFRKTGIIS
jgi:hypothetical protein